MNYNWFMTSVALFLNGDLGKKILRRILAHPDMDLKVVILNSTAKRTKSYEDEILEIRASLNSYFIIESLNENLEFNETLLSNLAECDFAISALFGHIIPNDVIRLFESRIINLHPSFLPFGKGSDPIPWGILSDNKQGATIHTVTKELDSGLILSQEEIEANIGMNAGHVYELCIDSLLSQFEEVLMQLTEESLELKPQESNTNKPRKSTELEKLRTIVADEYCNFDGFVRRLQALTYSDGRKPRFEDKQGNIWLIDFRLSRSE